MADTAAPPVEAPKSAPPPAQAAAPVAAPATEASKVVPAAPEAGKAVSGPPVDGSKTVESILSEPKVPADPSAKKEEKPVSEVKPPVVPEKYDLKLPEGATLDAGAVEKTASFSKEQGFTNDQAQALLNRDVQMEVGRQALLQKQVADLSPQWHAEIKNDKELGGQNFERTTARSRMAFKEFATPGLKKFLEDTGMTNNPELVRTFERIGSRMENDKFVRADTAVSTARNTAAERLFPLSELEGNQGNDEAAQ